ncbi:uncharacterized protein [Aristolochia californica]|uniref:uncharacterized protein n=1 Tax=Aristolochia californica TaxID=171875 RepID=UPI0035E2520B
MAPIKDCSSSLSKFKVVTPENGFLEYDPNKPKQTILFPNTHYFYIKYFLFAFVSANMELISSVLFHVAELINEISILELEISNLERYLLSLYRTAFDQYVAKLNSSAKDKDFGTSSSPGTVNIDERDGKDRNAEPSHSLYQDRSHHTDNLLPPESSQSISMNLEKSPSSENKSEPGHRSLADHLGASLHHVHETPNRLSEEILRCVSAIYCKLANAAPPNQVILSPFPSPSASSSSTFSPQYPSDIWSPRFDNEALLNTCDLEELKVSRGPYSGMVEVPKIRVDDERFHYAASMLHSFKSLIEHLEKVDPMILKHEEKLAFWINIHNALMMHAYLAYGDYRNHLKSGSAKIKASYNVGGCIVNAFVIHNAILGCQSRRSSLWLRSFFSSSGNKFRAGSGKHIYALDKPEPLVHFALCSGSYSDPAVRLYTGEGVMQELKLARAEFIRNSIHFHGDNKIILPKILNYYAKDACMQLSSILEMVNDCLPEAQRKVIQSLQGRSDKCVEWAPYISAFRYLIHRKLADERTSICSNLVSTA